MPAPVPASSSAQPADKAAPAKACPTKVQSRKKRAVRRRGRARNNLESDDEIEREAVSSESEDDDHDDLSPSSDDSATDDSDTEPGSEDVPSHPPIPSTTKDVAVEGVTNLNGTVAPFFQPSLAWSEMVTDENDNTAGGMPVIDFAEFNGPSKIPSRPHKKSPKHKHRKASASTPAAPPTQHSMPAAEAGATPASDESPGQAEPSKAPASPPVQRKLGQSARQAYQERLEKDPAYVPTVGGFWGHDDRLMNKELRSLSGWWRGQWEGRGRGRGRGYGVRGGARAGHDFQLSKEVDPEDLPPVERAWTHDGFEEMKKKDEEHQARQEALANRGRGGFRGGRGGRGGFAGRGRGSFKHRFHGSPARGISPVPGRVWFAMKPEHPWSKQSASFLFPGPGRFGKPATYRIKVPGKQEQFAKSAGASQTTQEPVPSPPVEVKEVHYVVRLPSKKQEPKKEPEVLAEAPIPVAVTETKEEASIEPETMPPSSASEEEEKEEEEEEVPSSQPSPAVVSQLEQLSIDPAASDPSRQAKMEEAVLRNPTAERLEAPESSTTATATDQRPVLPPLQTVFTPPPPPVSQPSPVYGSPYTYPHQMPPGIAFNHHGMPYEIATGRPVYLQAPPPPPMYNPRPLMHSQYGAPSGMPYGHVPHPSAMSPDFLAQPQSHTPPMNGFIDPSTGAPLFSLPRPNARLEIRAPDGSHRSPTTKPAATNRGPSKLRNTATVFEPTRLNDGSDAHYPSISTPSDGSGLPPSYEAVNGVMSDETNQRGQQSQQQTPVGHMMGYNPYQQSSYYYTEGYAYPGYMDMPQQQPMSYEGYGVDQGQGQQQAVYY